MFPLFRCIARRALVAGVAASLAATLPGAAGAAEPAAARSARAAHWAFQPPVRPVVPAVTGTGGGAGHPVDAFVLARLRREGLVPAPPADRPTLLRRLALDLTGLPPTVAEVDEFVADPRPDAYSRAVERLLASPHYGERWGRHWLDAARYADSDGFEKDKPRFVWAYRDWVVGAFNRDLPYDQFVIQQIAGDLLPGAGQDERVATGFLRNSMLNEEGGVDPEQFRMDAMFDRMDCVGKSVLGLTIQCAQCHDHKYDPFSQEEYYRLFAYLNNAHESYVVALTPDQERLRANLRRGMRDLEAGLQRQATNWAGRMARWEASVKAGQPVWQPVPAVNAGDNGERFYYYPDGSIRAASYAPTIWTAHFRGTNFLPFIGAFRLEQLTDPDLPCHGPGRSLKGMSALSEFVVEATDLKDPRRREKVKFIRATADFSNAEKDLEPEYDNRSGKRRPYGPVAFAIDGRDDTAWGIDAGPGRRNQSRQAVFVPERPLVFTNGVVFDFRLKQMHGGWNSDDNQNHNLGRFRLSVTAATNAVADTMPAAVREILAIPADRRSPAQVAAVFSHWRTTVPEFQAVNDRIEALWRQWPEGTGALALEPRAEERMTAILKRGDWLKPTRPVRAGVPAFLHPLPAGADDSRLTFARWLVDPRSPTTARVFVNRVWQAYFGVGLVETAEDFGVQAAAPSHPELLDWLACEFMAPSVRDGQPAAPWSIKHLHRIVVHSATYRQSSRVTPALLELDPYNRLLARGARFRVEGEIVRDIALAASGLLNPQLGGRAVTPPAPEFLFQPPASYGPKTWIEEKGPDRYRRSLYVFRFRSIPYPVLANFDAPNGDFSCVRRVRSNTPLQALTSLNETVFVECARALAERVVVDGGATDAARVEHLFRRCVSRAPTAAEREELLRFLARQRERFGEGWLNPWDLAGRDSARPDQLPPKTTPTQLAAWTATARVVLNLDETMSKE